LRDVDGAGAIKADASDKGQCVQWIQGVLLTDSLDGEAGEGGGQVEENVLGDCGQRRGEIRWIGAAR
jgi:hypothetical protein